MYMKQLRLREPQTKKLSTYQPIMNNLTMVHPYDGILPNNKKKLTIHATTGMNLKCTLPSERR